MLPILHRNGGGLVPSRVAPRLESFLGRVFEDMDQVFENAGMPAGSWSGVPLAMWEDEDHLYIEAEMPGLKQDEIDLTVHKGLLHIRARGSPSRAASTSTTVAPTPSSSAWSRCPRPWTPRASRRVSRTACSC